MLFFRRILEQSEIALPEQTERRNSLRYTINPEFPLASWLSLSPRESTAESYGDTLPGVQLPCRIVDCSEGGARIQLASGVRVPARNLYDLLISVEESQLTLPCRVAHGSEGPNGSVIGLQYDAMPDRTWDAYCQLLEVVALGATLRLQRRSTEPGESGYFEETYVNNRPARLSIWRHPQTRAVAAMEFRLRTYLVRQLAEGRLEFLTGAHCHPATDAQAEEISRLFKWVVRNLDPGISGDIRAYLQQSVQ